MNRVVTIARKETVETFRDRRAVVVTLLSAALAGPLFLALIFNMIAGQGERARTLVLPVDGAERAPALVAFLEREGVTIAPMPADAANRIRAGDLDVAMAIDPSFPQQVAEGRPAKVRLLYDRSRDRARASIEQAEGLLRAYAAQWGRQRLFARGIAPSVASPLDVVAEDLATPQQSGAFVLFLVAYYGLFAALMGGMPVALDTTAGERERQSLEPLLATPASPAEIVAGKWAAVATFRSRAERRGWQRGSVVDAGGVTSYVKTFPGAGVEVYLAIEGLYMGIDPMESITLGVARFARADTVKRGSYIYDDPGADDPRLLTFGQVPPVVYSETVGDLKAITAGSDET